MTNSEKGKAHRWIIKIKGKPSKCEHCGKKGLKGKKIHWANKRHEYKTKLSDWLRLCAKCHVYYDILNGLRKTKII